ncbi:Uncharacterised protein [Mycobacteroides abscessus subsp. massiliense]|nr:Uncharacterised protein [Mycobacteroides abscessus subsp. massiliense]SLA68435.1 Uncharacterised protein [Mycobacteroides abscessus subsp. massiliense]SLE08936.1 Uncharacterised protein [Mycobacteroides abscessus subsp. massiliense]
MPVACFSGEACHAIPCRQGTALINATGDKAISGAWCTVAAAALSLITLVTSSRKDQFVSTLDRSARKASVVPSRHGLAQLVSWSDYAVVG